jgi:hypothetical protein
MFLETSVFHRNTRRYKPVAAEENFDPTRKYVFHNMGTVF